MKKLKSNNHAGLISTFASLMAIALGLFIGLILLYMFNAPRAWAGFIKIISTGFTNSAKLGKVLYQAAPLMMTGLAVGFAFKTGLFNIGASGQYTMGAFFALLGAIVFQWPWWLCLLFAMVGGALWGAIPGLFKAYFNVNEVITAIMFNWIGVFTVNLIINNIPIMLANAWGDMNMDRTAKLTKANPSAILPKGGLNTILGGDFANAGIYIAIVFALIAWVILQRTTFGYELKACGYNRYASEYAGINAKRNIVLSMIISGAFAGVGGGIYYLSGSAQYTLLKELLATGFNGIPVALLASSHPLGTIFSALFVSHIQVGGDALQPEFARQMVEIIIAVIIYLSAFSLLMRGMIAKLFKRKTARQDKIDSGNTQEVAE